MGLFLWNGLQPSAAGGRRRAYHLMADGVTRLTAFLDRAAGLRY